METKDYSITELHRNMSEVITGARNGTLVTRITYHGLAVAAVVPLHGARAYAITKALRELEAQERIDAAVVALSPDGTVQHRRDHMAF